MWDDRYRPLHSGEIIQPGDECQDVNRNWYPARMVGEPAPDTLFTSHRLYRRKLPE